MQRHLSWLSQRCWMSTEWRCDYVIFRRCCDQKITLWQRCGNVEMFAGYGLIHLKLFHAYQLAVRTLPRSRVPTISHSMIVRQCLWQNLTPFGPAHGRCKIVVKKTWCQEAYFIAHHLMQNDQEVKGQRPVIITKTVSRSLPSLVKKDQFLTSM